MSQSCLASSLGRLSYCAAKSPLPHGMADDGFLIFVADWEGQGAKDDRMQAGRGVGKSQIEAEPDANRLSGQARRLAGRSWTQDQRKRVGAFLAHRRVKSKFVKHCARQADSIERNNMDLHVVRSDNELHGVSVKVRKLQDGARRGTGISFSWRAMVELTHGKRHAVTALADVSCTSRRTVRRITKVVAFCELEWQAYQLQEVLRMIMGCDIQYAGCRLAWDETAELVALNAAAGRSTPAQRGGHWEVRVPHWTFFWGGANAAQFIHVCFPSLPAPQQCCC